MLCLLGDGEWFSRERESIKKYKYNIEKIVKFFCESFAFLVFYSGTSIPIISYFSSSPVLVRTYSNILPRNCIAISLNASVGPFDKLRMWSPGSKVFSGVISSL